MVRIKSTLEEKKQYAKSRGFTLLTDKNVSVRDRIVLRKDSTGVEYETTWAQFEKADPRKTTLEYKKKYTESRGYTLLADKNFTNKDTVIVRDSKGDEYTIEWANFYRDGGTPNHTTLETKRKWAKERGYTLLATENFPVDEKVPLRNDKTGYIYEARFSDFIHKGYREKVGRTISRGEAFIHAFLETNLKEEYSFTYQERVCYDNGRIGYFDFSIKDSEGTIIAFIEYNGEQHYEAVSLFGEECLERTQESDRLKKEYAKAKGIPLLVIPYTDKDIANTIKKAFPEYISPKLKPFKPSRGCRSHTSLEEKREFAKSRGYIISPDITENFAHSEKVKLINIKTGEEWETFWFMFMRGAVPVKEARDRRRKNSLEEKKKIAEKLGYELLEKENFGVKKKAKLKDKKSGEILTITWEKFELRLKKSSKSEL